MMTDAATEWSSLRRVFAAGRGTKDTMLPMTSRFPSRHDRSKYATPPS
jgi:hypothetical protein